MAKDRDDDDYEDDEEEERPRKRSKSSGGGMDAVIPYRNGMALASYYCGIFGLISCFLGLGIFGLVPIILGFLGLKRASDDPEARGRAHAWIGIILGFIELLSCFAVVAWIAIAIMTDKRR